MRHPSPRMLKVNSTLREVIAGEVERFGDSRVGMVSVTSVDTAPNLRHARSFTSPFWTRITARRLSTRFRASPIGFSRRSPAKFGSSSHRHSSSRSTRVWVAGERMEALLRSLRQGQEEE